MGPVRVGAARSPARSTSITSIVGDDTAAPTTLSPSKDRDEPSPGASTTMMMMTNHDDRRALEEPAEDGFDEEEEESDRPLLLQSSLRSSLRGLYSQDASSSNGKATQKVLFASSSKSAASVSSTQKSSSNKTRSFTAALLPASLRGKGADSVSPDRQPPRRSRRRLLGRRNGSEGYGYDEGDDEYDHDPVMALFHARANHRVTFCLEQRQQQQQQQQQQQTNKSNDPSSSQNAATSKGVKGKEHRGRNKIKRGRALSTSPKDVSAVVRVEEPLTSRSKTRSSSLHKFVRTALFSGKSEKPASLADIEAEVAQVHTANVDDSLDEFDDNDDDDSAPNPARQRYLGDGSPSSDDDGSSMLPSALSSSSASSVSSSGRGSIDALPGSPSPPRNRAKHYGGLGRGGNVDSSDGSEPPVPPPPPPVAAKAAQFLPATVSSSIAAASATTTASSSSSPKSVSTSATTPKRRSIRWGSGSNSNNSPSDRNEPPSQQGTRDVSSPKGSPLRIAAKVTTPPPPKAASSPNRASFVEQKNIRSQVNVLLNKANRAHHVHYRYEYAVKCCMKALELQKKAHYPEDHPTVLKTLQYLNTAHHALSSLENSANIVKMGIKYEDAGDWIRALKMYTIAYRIRRDNLSSTHPSLVVLLNMLGSIQVKRDELEEAMEIFELALKDDPRLLGDDEDHRHPLSLHDDDDYDDDPHVHEHKEADPPRHPRKGQLQRGRAGTAAATTANNNSNNVLAKSVAYREMGTIYERWGDVDEALKMYHRSLDCIAEYKGLVWEAPVLSLRHHPDVPTLDILPTDDDASPAGMLPIVSPSSGPSATTPSPSQSLSTPSPSHSLTNTSSSADDDVNNTTISSCPVSLSNEQDILLDLEPVNHLSRSFVKHATVIPSHKEGDGQYESGMELFLNGDEDDGSRRTVPAPLITSTCYDVFFQGSGNVGRGKKNKSKDASTANVDVALTLHQIGQLHRAEGEYNLALAAYVVSLRGMKDELGKNHPNVAAVLGNIGNLQKEMGDLNAAYETYQQVLAIESYRLGLSHPDVAVTLHNIATIDAARGNHKNALILYEQVLSLQRKLFGDDHLSLAVTASCMGDVYERIGEIDKAIDAFDEALRIKTSVSGRHSIEVGRILHKLGKLSALNGDVQLADSYLSRTVLIYRLNKMRDDDGWMIEVNRDVADIDALIAMGRSEDLFEC